MMKTALLALILILASPFVSTQVHAQSACSQLFTEPSKTYARDSSKNSYELSPHIPLELAQEGREFTRALLTKLVLQRSEVEYKVPTRISSNTRELETKLEDSLNYFMSDMKSLRDDVYRLKENLTADLNPSQAAQIERQLAITLNRLKDENSGLVKRASEYMSANGIEHSIGLNQNKNALLENSFYIVLGKDGEHFLNQLAKRLYEGHPKQGQPNSPYHLDIIFDTARLLESGADGLYSHLQKGHHIILDPSILLNNSVIRNKSIRNSTALHEFNHRVNVWRQEHGMIKPYHAEITPKKLDFDTRNKLAIYYRFLSVDELVAYRTSLRVMIYHAIKNKDNVEIAEFMFDQAKNEVSTLIDLSTVTNQVFSKLQSMEQARPYTSSFPRDINVTVGSNTFRVKTPAELKPQDTVEMSQFTKSLYTLIGAKLHGVSNKSLEEKIIALRQVARVLSLRSVRNLDGNYPSQAEIIKLLNEKPGN